MICFHFPHPSHAISDCHHCCNPGIQETQGNIGAAWIFQILNAFLPLWERSRKWQQQDNYFSPLDFKQLQLKKKWKLHLFSLQWKYLSWPRKSISVITYCVNSICLLVTIGITVDSQSLFEIPKSLVEVYFIVFYCFILPLGYLFTELWFNSVLLVNVASLHTGGCFIFWIMVYWCVVTSLQGTQTQRDAGDLSWSAFFSSWLVGENLFPAQFAEPHHGSWCSWSFNLFLRGRSVMQTPLIQTKSTWILPLPAFSWCGL